MLRKFGAVSLLLLSACSSPVSNSQSNETPLATGNSPSPSESPVAALAASTAPSAAPTASVMPDKYQEALNTAASAQSIGQSALNQEDWNLVASQWQESINLLRSVPRNSTNHQAAQRILPQYEQNRDRARQKSATFKSRQLAAPSAQSLDGLTMSPNSSRSFQIPIVKKLEGVPIVEITINGERSQMLLDTGASRTLITKGLSQKLALQATGSTMAKTANGSASFDTVTLSSVQVGKIEVSNLSVAVGNDDMNYGLLGHDIYKGYDITLREDSVVFEKR